LIASYPNANEIYWAQEEPRNMGASWYVQVNFPVKFTSIISPAASASTAPGSSKLAASRYEALLTKIFNA
jgi:2-oxoglutarate dehydrogenase complex dehydrogenase (E1) component-like enzyme